MNSYPELYEYLESKGIYEFWASVAFDSYSDYSYNWVDILLPTEDSEVINKADELSLIRDYTFVNIKLNRVFGVSKDTDMFRLVHDVGRLEHRLLNRRDTFCGILEKYSVTDFWAKPYFEYDMSGKDIELIIPFENTDMCNELYAWYNTTYGGSQGSFKVSCFKNIKAEGFQNALADGNFEKVRPMFTDKYNRFVMILKKYGVNEYYTDSYELFDVRDRKPFGELYVPIDDSAYHILDAMYMEDFNIWSDDTEVYSYRLNTKRFETYFNFSDCVRHVIE